MSTAAQRRTVGNAVTAAGILLPPGLLEDLTEVTTSEARRDAQRAELEARYPDLGRGLATKLVDLAREALGK